MRTSSPTRRTLGLDAERIAGDIANGTYAKRVREDFRSGVRSGVNGTPTFFINGERYEGPWADEPRFIRALQDAALIGTAHGTQQDEHGRHRRIATGAEFLAKLCRAAWVFQPCSSVVNAVAVAVSASPSARTAARD